MKPLYFITSNPGKFAEAKAFFAGTGIVLRQKRVRLEEVQDIDPKRVIEHKMREALRHGLRNFFIDDSSILIDGMGKLPGPFLKWFEDELSKDGLPRLAKAMGKGTAVMSVLIGYADAQGRIYYFRGVTQGRLVAPRGTKDFGMGVNFEPKGLRKTFGEMSFEEKRPWSMRAKALRKLKKHLSAAD